MLRSWQACTVALLLASWTAVATAGPRPPLGNNPHPIGGGSGHATQRPAARSAASAPAAHEHHEAHGRPQGACPPHYFSRPYYGYYAGYWPSVGAVYGYDPYYGSDFGYGYAYPYLYSSPYYAYPPPIVLPAEQLYGLGAVQRFMGVDAGLQPRANVTLIVPPAGANARNENNAGNAREPPEPSRRATNPQSTALGWKFIGFGDALFAEQKYAEANDRYRKASRSAPQLADAWFRQAFAMTAINRYDLAVGAIKRGLKLDANWPKSDFEVNDLYGADEMAKKAHLESLASAAEERPNDADLLFMVGVHLHFDGQAKRAAAFFQRAKQIAGGAADHIDAFLLKK